MAVHVGLGVIAIAVVYGLRSPLGNARRTFANARPHNRLPSLRRRAGRALSCRCAMYRFLYWLVLRRLPAEATHRVSFALLRALARVPGVAATMSRLLVPRAPELRVRALGRDLPGPLG